jgi:hypothetical protein
MRLLLYPRKLTLRYALGNVRFRATNGLALTMTVLEPQALEGGTVRAKRARAAGLPQRLKRCVAMWCDALRRVAERCDAPRRVALPTVMSISPTRLIDNRNMVQSRIDFKTALLP